MLEEIVKLLTEIRDMLKTIHDDVEFKLEPAKAKEATATVIAPVNPTPVAALPSTTPATTTIAPTITLAEKVTRAMVGEKLVALSTKDITKAQGVLSAFGVNALGALTEDKYADIYAMTVAELAKL